MTKEILGPGSPTDQLIRKLEKQNKDDEINEILTMCGEELFDKVSEKIRDIKIQAYEPTCIVIWEGYYRELVMFLKDFGYGTRAVDKESGFKILLGLKVVRTQIPDVLEVY